MERVGSWSKKDTNDKYLYDLRLALERPDEPSAFAEMSAQQETHRFGRYNRVFSSELVTDKGKRLEQKQ